MSETKFHPGPWNTFKADPALAPNSYVVDSADHRVARSIHDRFDACLIAAAPELYEALEEFTMEFTGAAGPRDISKRPFWNAILKRAQAALAKARGESQ